MLFKGDNNGHNYNKTRRFLSNPIRRIILFGIKTYINNLTM